MKLDEAYRELSSLWDDALVISNFGHSAWSWSSVEGHMDRVWYHQFMTMGLTGSLALGLAINRPEASVWMLDGDGSFALNLGTILAEAEQQPNNLIRFMTSNRSYRTIGDYPYPVCERLDYVHLAAAVGIDNIFVLETVEECRTVLPEVVRGGEYAFVVFEVDKDMPDKHPIPWEASEMKFRFARHIESQFNIRVLDDWGY